MSLPTTKNPRKYTLTTKVSYTTHRYLLDIARAEYDGNMSRLLNDVIEHAFEAEALPEAFYKWRVFDQDTRG
jgi:hypothetical protein